MDTLLSFTAVSLVNNILPSFNIAQSEQRQLLTSLTCTPGWTAAVRGSHSNDRSSQPTRPGQRSGGVCVAPEWQPRSSHCSSARRSAEHGGADTGECMVSVEPSVDT